MASINYSYLASFTKHNVYSGCILFLFSKTDPFGGDPFKESDPFRASASDDFFKKHTKNDPFTSDPFTKNPSLPSKVSDVGRGSTGVYIVPVKAACLCLPLRIELGLCPLNYAY